MLYSDEVKRLMALQQLEVVGTPPHESFERIVDLMVDRFDVPMAAIPLIDANRQWFKAQRGLDMTETPREFAFCNHTIRADDILVVPDATRDPRFADNPYVTGALGIRFYAGAPLILAGGERVGSVCVIDTRPRDFDARQAKALKMFAETVVELLDRHRAAIDNAHSLKHVARQQNVLMAQRDALRRDQVLLRQIASVAKIGGWTLDMRDNALTWSPEIHKLFEVDEGFVPTFENVLDFIKDSYREEFRTSLQAAMQPGGRADNEVPIRTAKGNLRWARRIAEPEYADGELVRLIGTIQDVTDQVDTQSQLQALAYDDAITGVPNRHSFLADLGRATSGATALPIALLMIDLDEFKAANDLMGHEAGDRVLKALAGRFQAATSGRVYRVGGDEFAVLLPGASKREIVATAVRMVKAAAQPIRLTGQEVRVGASVGVARYPSHATTGAGLMRAADVALYSAKRAGRGRCKMYQAEDASRFEKRNSLLQQVKSGLNLDQFTVAYQPLIDLRTLEIAGFEALLRWFHPTRGLLAAGAFMDALEDAQVGNILSDRALTLAVREFAGWVRAGLAVGTLSVNLSPGQMQNDNLVAGLSALLRREDLRPSRLKLEITETISLGRGMNVENKLQALNDLGVVLELDDFGTGYASLSHLRNTPAQGIKIDKSFVRAMETNRFDRTIVKAMIDLAHGLSLSVVAEGIETAEAGAALQLMGCDRGQGYYYGKPMLGIQIPDFVAAWRAAPDAGRVRLAQAS